MPRSIDATLKSAMSGGSYTAYFLVTVREVGHSILETRTPLHYKLTPTTLTVKFARSSNLMYSWDPGELEIKLTRGVTVSGVNYTLDSSYFYIVDSSWDGTYQYLEACLLPEEYYTVAGDDTYENVITDVCSHFGKTAVFKRDTEAWLDYQFLPAGRSLVLPKASNLFNILKQKYLVYACDNGSDEILFDAVAIVRSYTTDHSLNMYSFIYRDFLFYKQFLSRDENNTVHKSGPTTAPYFNLGFLESTASHPDVTSSGRKHDFDPIPVKLEYLTFDRFKLTYPNLSGYYFNGQVTEIFDPTRKNLAWHMILENFHWAESTEGGTMPSTIEASAPYTPLNTSPFNNILSDKDNNIQAAIESLDDHTHLSIVSSAPTSPITGSVFALDTTTSTFYVWNGSSWTAISGGTVEEDTYILREDSAYILREDGTKFIRE